MPFGMGMWNSGNGEREHHPTWSCGSESLRDLGSHAGPHPPPATQQEFWAPRAPPHQDPRGEKRSPNLEKQSDLLKNV